MFDCLVNRAYSKQFVDADAMPTEVASAPAGTMLIPNSLYYPIVDFVLVSDVDPGGVRLFALVQVTVVQRHELREEDANTFMSLIAAIGASSSQVAGVFFFVPPAVYKGFTGTKVPSIAGYTGRMIKCTVKK